MYVGKTERKLNARFKEHQRSFSPVGHHVDYRNYSIDEESISVLNQEIDRFRRGDSHPAGSVHSQQREGEAHPPIDLPRALAGHLATLRVRF